MRSAGFQARALLFLTAAIAASAGPLYGTVPPIPAQFADAPAIELEDFRWWSVRYDESETYREKRRVLVRERAAFDWADQQLFYRAPESRLVRFSARTVRPDGSVVPVPADLRRESVLVRRENSELRVLNFTFPAVVPGAVLEWEYELEGEEPRPSRWWSVQSETPLLEARFTAHIEQLKRYRDFYFESYSRQDADLYCEKRKRSDDQGRTLEITCRDLPGLEDESWDPPANDRRLAILLRWGFGSAGSLSDWMWRRRNEYWADLVEDFNERTDNVRARVARLVHDEMSEAEKLDTIYRFVKQHVQVRAEDFATASDDGKPPAADDILAAGGGEGFEVTLLTLAMLRSAGITAFPLLANDRSSRSLVYDMPDFGQARHLMLEVVVDRQNGFLDPSCDYCPPGIPDWRYCGEDPSGVRLRPEPMQALRKTVPAVPAEYNSEVGRETATIAPDGSMVVEGRATWHGQQDVTWRRRWADLTPAGRERDFLRRIAGDLRQDSAIVSDPRDHFTTLTADYRYERPGGMQVLDGKILVRPNDRFTAALQIPVQEERVHPLWYRYARSVRLQTEYLLPAGYSPREVPAGKQVIDGPGMRFESLWRQAEDGARLEWIGLLSIRTTRIDVEQYREAVDFSVKLRRQLRDGLLLQREPDS